MADDIRVRIGIGSVLIVAITGLVYFDHWSGHGWGAITLSVVLMGLGLLEYARMAGNLAPVAGKTLALAGALYVLSNTRLSPDAPVQATALTSEARTMGIPVPRDLTQTPRRCIGCGTS